MTQLRMWSSVALVMGTIGGRWQWRSWDSRDRSDARRQRRHEPRAGRGARTGDRRPVPTKLVVSDETGGRVVLVDGNTGEIGDAIPVGKRPRGLRALKDGKHLLVALSGSPIADRASTNEAAAGGSQGGWRSASSISSRRKWCARSRAARIRRRSTCYRMNRRRMLTKRRPRCRSSTSRRARSART